MQLSDTADWNAFICDIFKLFYGYNLSSVDILAFVNNSIAALWDLFGFHVLLFDLRFLLHFLLSSVFLSNLRFFKNNKKETHVL